MSERGIGNSFSASPPRTGTTQLFHPLPGSVVVYAMRDPSGEKRSHLQHVVVRKLDGLAVGKKLHVVLAACDKGIRPAKKSEHMPIRGQHGRSCGVGKIGDLHPVAAWGSYGRCRGNGIKSTKEPATSRTIMSTPLLLRLDGALTKIFQGDPLAATAVEIEVAVGQERPLAPDTCHWFRQLRPER